MGKRISCSAEYKSNAVELVNGGKSVASVARELGVTETSLRRWIEDVKPPVVDKDARITELESAVKRLKNELHNKEDESAILKKAFGIFVKP